MWNVPQREVIMLVTTLLLLAMRSSLHVAYTQKGELSLPVATDGVSNLDIHLLEGMSRSHQPADTFKAIKFNTRSKNFE